MKNSLSLLLDDVSVSYKVKTWVYRCVRSIPIAYDFSSLLVVFQMLYFVSVNVNTICSHHKMSKVFGFKCEVQT